MEEWGCKQRTYESTGTNIYIYSVYAEKIAYILYNAEFRQESEFEEIWKTRNTYLENEPGFVKFNLLKGPEREDHLLYASHTLWESEDHFTAWTKSEAFRKAHEGAGNRGHLYLGHPEFEGYKRGDKKDGFVKQGVDAQD